MQVVISIAMDNAAFEGSACAPELARILRGLASRIEAAGLNIGSPTPGDEMPLRDVNGNRCGVYRVEA